MAESLRTGVRSVYLPQHIVVLVHGNNGSAADFDAVEAALKAKFGERQMLIIKSRANEPDTSLGVEIGGTRLAKEVVEAVFEYDLSPAVSSYKLSVIGHSLGGLYARYAIVQIMDALSCLHMEYVDFVTICTPHLGSRRARGPSTVKVGSVHLLLHVVEVVQLTNRKVLDVGLYYRTFFGLECIRCCRRDRYTDRLALIFS